MKFRLTKNFRAENCGEKCEDCKESQWMWECEIFARTLYTFSVEINREKIIVIVYICNSRPTLCKRAQFLIRIGCLEHLKSALSISSRGSIHVLLLARMNPVGIHGRYTGSCIVEKRHGVWVEEKKEKIAEEIPRLSCKLCYGKEIWEIVFILD